MTHRDAGVAADRTGGRDEGGQVWFHNEVAAPAPRCGLTVPSQRGPVD